VRQMMNQNNVREGIEYIVRESIEKIDDNLKAIILVGSVNNEDFVEGISDVDLLYVLGYVDVGVLEKIREMRTHGEQYTGCKVDIKPFTKDEFNAAIRGVGSFEFFTGWGLEMIKSWKQPCLYHSSDFSIDYEVDEKRFKQDALERAHYYITKLRTVISADNPLLIRGEQKVLVGDELLKVAASSIKNVLRFCLAYQGIITDDSTSIMIQSGKYFGDVQDITAFLELRNKKYFEKEAMFNAYESIEQIYQKVVQNA